MSKSNTLLLHRFKKIRQNLFSKETYVPGKAAAIAFEPWVQQYSTLLDKAGLGFV